MATNTSNFILTQLSTTPTAEYTATNVKTIIDKFTVTNTNTVNVQFSINIVSSGGSEGDGNLLIKNKTVQPNETYTCPEVIGHVLNPSAFISAVASVASSLTLRASGREIS